MSARVSGKMPKRSATEKLHHYEKKIKKLLKKQNTAKRRRIQRLDSSDDDHNNSDSNKDQNNTDRNEAEPEAGPSNSLEINDQISYDVLMQPEAGELPLIPDQETTSVEPATTSEVTLVPELMAALVASTSDRPDFGEDIHVSLAKLWTPLLQKGLQKDEKEKLLKEYLIPGNCQLLQAPKLNAEISAAISEVVRGRDKKFIGFQQQLGTGTSAINRAMDILISSDNKIQALKHLSDGCRILIDLHHSLTKDRIKLITPSLEKNFLHIIQDSERDDSLFGSSLSDKIKASKAIERQGSQIRKTFINQKPATVQSTAHRPVPQGNWAGPSRYLFNRGGRGGQNHRGQRPAAPRRTYPPSNPSKVYSNQTRPRAPPQ